MFSLSCGKLFEGTPQEVSVLCLFFWLLSTLLNCNSHFFNLFWWNNEMLLTSVMHPHALQIDFQCVTFSVENSSSAGIKITLSLFLSLYNYKILIVPRWCQLCCYLCGIWDHMFSTWNIWKHVFAFVIRRQTKK